VDRALHHRQPQQRNHRCRRNALAAASRRKRTS
jgi:hypothetical protein